MDSGRLLEKRIARRELPYPSMGEERRIKSLRGLSV
jgi:hypothetical protein